VKPEKGVVGPALSHILETDVGDDISLYNPRTEQVVVLNGTASDIWRLADGTHTKEEITALLASSYQVSPDSIGPDVEKTVGELVEAGLIESP
jgi:hypothetical protein